MKALESKVPPPIVAFLSAAVMFGGEDHDQPDQYQSSFRARRHRHLPLHEKPDVSRPTDAAFGLYGLFGCPLGFARPLAFALFITRFQIIPEEPVLAAKFGDVYRAYQEQVRRWL